MFSRPLDCIHFVIRSLGLMPFLVSVWCIRGLQVDCHFRGYKDRLWASFSCRQYVTKPQPLTQGFSSVWRLLRMFYVQGIRKIQKIIVRLKLKTTLMNKINISTSYNFETQFNVDKKNQLNVTFCMTYFSSNSCSTCFGQPCAHHQELTTAWCYSLVLVCAVAAARLSSPVGR